MNENASFQVAPQSIRLMVSGGMPSPSDIQITEKHLPGKHDQRTHTPKAYLGSTSSDEVRQLADPKSKVNQDAVKNWDKLSQKERMALANPDAINLRMQEQLDRYRTDYKAAHDLAGEKLTAKTYSKIADNANARIDSLKDALNPATEQKLRSYVDDHMQKAVEGALKEGGLKDVSAADMDALMQRNVDKLVFQEIESRKRQLGDHGIRHVLGNVESMDMMFDDPDFPEISGMDRVVALQTMVDHDMGYTAGIATQSFAATKSHEMFSEQYAKSEGYEKLFGADNAKELQRLVATHAEKHVDWEKDPVASAVRTADNTALFAKEKYPALFNDVPGAASELYRLQLAQVGGSTDKVLPVVKKNLKDLVDKSDLDPRQKEDLGMAVEEVFPLSGKFTLGMGAAEIQGYDYADGLMHVKVRNKPEREALNGVFDLGDRQFGKFMDAYDLDGAPDSGLRLKDKKSGKAVIQIDSSDAKEPTTGELGELYSISVRPTIRSVQRQLGPSSTRSNREKIWPAIEAKLGEKLTASELSSFKSHFLAGTLDQFPLTEKENAFLTRERLKELGLGWLGGLLKHLPGRHDQKTHTPKIYGTSGRMRDMDVSDPGKIVGDEAIYDWYIEDVVADSMSGISEALSEIQDPVTNEMLEADISMEERARWKEQVVAGLADRTGLPEDYVNGLVRTWAETSNDSHPVALGIQKAASEEFGVELSDWQQERTRDVVGRYGSEEMLSRGSGETVQEVYDKTVVDGRKLLRASYETTQEELRKTGKDTITLYRGVKGEHVPHTLKEGDVVPVTPNAIESWSLSYDVAYNFARKTSKTDKENAVVLKAEVPIERILSTPKTGAGCLAEFEFLVLGREPGGADYAGVVEMEKGIYWAGVD